MDSKKKKIFKSRAMLKQTSASAKELDWRQDCLLSQSVGLNYAKEKLLSELLWLNQSVTEMLGRSSNKSGWIIPEWKYNKYESTSLTVRLKESAVVFVCCTLQSQPQKRSMMKGTNMFFFFTLTIKIQSED